MGETIEPGCQRLVDSPDYVPEEATPAWCALGGPIIEFSGHHLPEAGVGFGLDVGESVFIEEIFQAMGREAVIIVRGFMDFMHEGGGKVEFAVGFENAVAFGQER